MLMDKDYFKELQKNIPDQVASEKSHIDDMAFLVVHADIDCELFCDGESLCQLKTNKVQKISVPLGNHTLSIESDKNKDFVRHYSAQYTKKGENYNFSIILKQEEDNYLQKLGIAKSMEEDFQQKLNEKDEQITKLKTENSKRQKEIENIKNITASEKDSLSSLINKKDTEIAKLKEDFNKKELTIKRNYQQDCEGLASKLKEESSLELKRLSTQLKEKEGEITELKAEISELRAALKDPYKKASEDLELKLQDEYEKRILQLKTIHERELKDKTDEYDKAKKELENQIKEEKSVHNKEITKLQSTIDDINSNHQEEIIKLKEQVRSEAETFKSEVEKGVHDLQKRIKELESIVEQKNEEIRQLQSKQSKGLFGIFK